MVYTRKVQVLAAVAQDLIGPMCKLEEDLEAATQLVSKR
jgi:hypothetical protein